MENEIKSTHDAALRLQKVMSLINRRVLLAQEMQSIDLDLNALTAPNPDLFDSLNKVLTEGKPNENN